MQFSRIIITLVLTVALVAGVVWLSPFVYFAVQRSWQTQVFKQDQQDTAIEQENARLRQALQLNRTKEQLITEIAYSSIWVSNNLQLGRGSAQGVQIGQAVTNLDGTLIGKITRVSDQTAEVMLLTDPKFEIPITVGYDGADGILLGQYGYSAKLNWLTPAKVVNDQVIYTTALSDRLPTGIPVGTATNYRPDQSGSFYQADVVDLASFLNTRGLVLIWIK